MAERGVKWERRNPEVAGLAAAVVLVLTLGVGVASYFAFAGGRKRRQPALLGLAARVPLAGLGGLAVTPPDPRLHPSTTGPRTN